MAEVFTLHIDAGATWRIEFEYTNEDQTIFDLTGYTAVMQLRETAQSADLALELTADIDISKGYLTFIATAAETATLLLPKYVYAVELSKDEEVIRLVEGGVHVSPEVVR